MSPYYLPLLFLLGKTHDPAKFSVAIGLSTGTVMSVRNSRSNGDVSGKFDLIHGSPSAGGLLF